MAFVYMFCRSHFNLIFTLFLMRVCDVVCFDYFFVFCFVHLPGTDARPPIRAATRRKIMEVICPIDLSLLRLVAQICARLSYSLFY